jgi:DNA-binding transcriptional LysR family regulator
MILDRLHEMEVFVAVAEAQGLARAGRRLRLSAPAVTRAVASLEDRLGVRLLNRTTRSLNLTEAGARFLDHARRILAEIEAAEKMAAGERAVPQGRLTVTTAVALGHAIVHDVIRAFLAAHPRVSVSALFVDRQVNLVEEGVDVGLRIGDLPDSPLMARRVGAVRRILAASPAYLARRGIPEVPADLGRHEIVAFTGIMPNREWRHAAQGGRRAVALAPRLEINDIFCALAAVEAGEGIGLLPSFMIGRQMAAGRLAPVLDAFALPPLPVHLIWPEARLIEPKLRAFIDFAAPRLAHALADLGPGREGVPSPG